MLDLAHELAWIKAWLQTTGKVGRNFGTTLPCAALYTALLSPALLITMLCGLPAAQTPSIANEPTLTPTEPALTPAVPGPLEIVPSPQEKLLAPVPQQFNWLERETPSNPLLEGLLTLREPSGLTVTASLTEDVSDNFAHAPGSHQVDSRTGVVLGTVYRLDDGQSFVSLANTIRAFYQARTATSQIGYANLVLRAGYELPPLSFGLADNFMRGDNAAQAQTQEAALALLRTEQRFLRNSITPQVRYDISPVTTATLSYTNTVVVDESGTQGTSTSHSVSPGLQHQFSPGLSGHMGYTFTTFTGSGLSGSRSHRLTTDLGYQLDFVTSAILSAFGTFVERSTSTSTTGGQNVLTYGASIGVRRVLFSTINLFGAVGPTVFKRQGGREALRVNWQLTLDGPIPLTPSLTLSLATQQSIVDTVGEVNNVGLVLRQVATARLTYTYSAFLTTALFVHYSRNELLENSGTMGGQQGRIDNLSSAGVTATYALTNVIALTGTYLYQRRDSNQAINNFDENRLSLAVTGRFPIF